MSLITCYNPLPITFTHGEGVWLYDEKGNRYLDGFSGIAVCGLGHAHPDVTRTIQQQAAKLLHTSNAFRIAEQQALAERLVMLTGMQQAFFCNSGAEANESAVKLTRLYGHKKGIEAPLIIVMEGAFHGRTMAALSASGSPKTRAGFDPLVPGFIRVPYNDIQAIRTIAANHKDIVAVMVEPVLGEGGVIVPDDTYLPTLSVMCKENDWLFILDEVQTGNGRTGKLFAYMHHGITPDILTTAKGLGNGMPIGACLMSGNACDLFKPGNHGSTYGGNPLACATALTVLDVIERDQLCEKVARQQGILKEKLIYALSDHPHVREIRGQGYLIGIEMDQPAAHIRSVGLDHGVLLNVTVDSVIRLLPALIMTEAELELLADKVITAIRSCEWKPSTNA